MKKIKWTIMSLVVLFSIGAAFATRPPKLQALYYFTGSAYMPVVGAMGQNWICVSPTTFPCTYTYANGVYSIYTNDAQYEVIGIDGTPNPVGKKRN